MFVGVPGVVREAQKTIAEDYRTNALGLKASAASLRWETANLIMIMTRCRPEQDGGTAKNHRGDGCWSVLFLAYLHIHFALQDLQKQLMAAKADVKIESNAKEAKVVQST